MNYASGRPDLRGQANRPDLSAIFERLQQAQKPQQGGDFRPVGFGAPSRSQGPQGGGFVNPMTQGQQFGASMSPQGQRMGGQTFGASISPQGQRMGGNPGMGGGAQRNPMLEILTQQNRGRTRRY